MKIGEISE